MSAQPSSWWVQHLSALEEQRPPWWYVNVAVTAARAQEHQPAAVPAPRLPRIEDRLTAR